MMKKTSVQGSTFEHAGFTNTMVEFRVFVWLRARMYARDVKRQKKAFVPQPALISKEVRNFHRQKRRCKRDGKHSGHTRTCHVKNTLSGRWHALT